MTQFQSILAAGEEGGRTVVVGVKLDGQSRELLTWALVKVAQTGDRVVALHVLNNNEIVDREGKSSLLSLVKAFDSILAVYEGFCNLKQVDLKLKICRGSSIRKILVREANAYLANDLIVGTARNHHTIRSSASVAKYCAKKLPSDCSVLAVNNGKVVFHREASRPSLVTTKEIELHQRNGLLSAIQRTLSKNSKVLNGNGGTNDQSAHETLGEALLKSGNVCAENAALKQNCSICSPDYLPDSSCTQSSTDEPSRDSNDESSMALVPVEKLEPASTSISQLIKELPEVRPGWPLLRRAVFSNRQATDGSSVQQISVVQWALRLPSRHPLSVEDLDKKLVGVSFGDDKNNAFKLDGESGAIVPFSNENISHPSSPEKSGSVSEELVCLHEKYAATCRFFKYEELVSATLDFSSDNVIGKGGSSKVYKGCLPDGKELAVKILKPTEDSLREFVLEIEIITALHHKNIISLFGFCFEGNHLLLVYDFLSRGSLEENLHGTKKDPQEFRWSERYKVAVGVAEALDYLHSRDDQPVIHRDVKSSNILLSDDFEPQLSDFGLAKWASTTSSHITCTDVAGTFGYLAPEYFMYGKVNDKIDVYAFGVVLLELLSGRKPINSNYPKGQESLVMWAKPILNSGKYGQLLDPSLGSNYDREQVEKMVLAASLCVRRAPRARPQMSLIVKLLQGEVETMKWARLQVNGSEAKLRNSMEGGETLDDDTYSQHSNIQSHLNLALLGVEEDSVSVSSIEQHISLEDYLRGRWSRSSSLD
ncbi:PREDICTED: probable receptor-like serine/threonine-protein kinase At5g57670 [Ipomoea nil]|uniref:probable receptor-like serine/threonine-protein kinase At5g57670 n=1 Tax=Ipomoea nil TaxID=35883 RepID=UPI0009013654|nr:PREDICTED: probable receptor-like serine/threonine-protein kinase At5g57670 [Ipomoea nil]XP_019175292.1 PREDICTED: probable receptor-like serine/threonine-protein kinase At5g57670 [Ipomoea nil]